MLRTQIDLAEGGAKQSKNFVEVKETLLDGCETWTPRDWIKKIIGMIQNKNDFNAPQNSDGQTILMCATKYTGCKVMQQVLNAKGLVDVNVRDIHGNTALSIAAELGDIEKMNLLLENGADVILAKEKISNKASRKLCNLINEPFLKAIYNGDCRKVKSLLENTPVDVNAKLSFSDMSDKRMTMLSQISKYTFGQEADEWVALVCAAQKGYKDIVELLLKQPNIDVNIRDNQGFSALIRAAQERLGEIVELLLEQPNIDVNAQSNIGITALECAACNGYKEITKMLLRHPNINVNLQGSRGTTVLMGSIHFFNVDDVLQGMKETEVLMYLMYKLNKQLYKDIEATPQDRRKTVELLLKHPGIECKSY